MLIERCGRLVKEQPVGPLEQGARDGEALLFPRTQLHGPALAFVKARCQGFQRASVQCRGDVGVGELPGRRRVGHGVTKTAHRDVRPLRQEQQARVLGHADTPAAIGPDAGEGAKQGAFAASRGAAQQHPLAREEMECRLLEDAPALASVFARHRKGQRQGMNAWRGIGYHLEAARLCGLGRR